MIRHTLLAFSIGFIVFLLYLMQYTGFFKSVTLAMDQRGPYTLVYKDYQGAYYKIVPTIEEVEKWAKEQGLSCRLSFGLYLDNPELIEEGRLRAKGGCLIDPKNQEEAKRFETLKAQLPADYKIEIFPESRSVVALFGGSPGIGPMRVYPKAYDFMKEQKLTPQGPVLEIYEIFDSKSMHTTYVWPLLEETKSSGK